MIDITPAVQLPEKKVEYTPPTGQYGEIYKTTTEELARQYANKHGGYVIKNAVSGGYEVIYVPEVKK